MMMHAQQEKTPDEIPPESSDTAHQSLADALRASFRILKVILVVVVILYVFSGVEILEQNQKALVFRFGELQTKVLGPGGLVKALPRPIDEIIRVPVTEKRTTTIQTQDIHLKEDELRTAAYRSGGLDPAIDGSIMTGDKGLVHVTWIVTYEIKDLKEFVSNLYGAEEQSETDFIQDAVENAAIAAIGQKDAYKVVTGDIGEIQREVQERSQQILDSLNSGIQIATVKAKTNWPKQTENAFLEVTNASNEQNTKISKAEQFKTERLHATAGVAYGDLEKLFDEYHAARSVGEFETAEGKMKAVEQIILSDATTGWAGERIRQAESFRRSALEDIRADVDEFRSLQGEYERNPELLITRLWYETQQEILSYPGVTKRYVPPGQGEIRLLVSPDPEEKRARERRRYQKDEKAKGDFTANRPAFQRRLQPARIRKAGK